MTAVIAFVASLIMFVIGCIRLVISGAGEIHNADHFTAHRRRVNRGIRRHFVIAAGLLTWAVTQLMTMG